MFPTSFDQIQERLLTIDPLKYGQTRNYVDGDVTYLSPYISRGVLSTKDVLVSVLKRGYHLQAITPFVKELAWRDYFQRVWQVRTLEQELKHIPYSLHHETPSMLINASTGITAIDKSITHLTTNGYMHNHIRMYVAGIACTILKAHWLNPAKWMYYHLLDGDWGSNACSWQWVSGAFSNKPYFANQENINKYTHSNQQATFLDYSYEELLSKEVSDSISHSQLFEEQTPLPQSDELDFDISLPTFLYNYYNLDPLWHSTEKGNRILLIEPSIFQQYPVSASCLAFMINLSMNIPSLQVFVGSFEELTSRFSIDIIYYKEHPLTSHYTGTKESRDWLSEKITGYYPSFFAYWKKLEKELILTAL